MNGIDIILRNRAKCLVCGQIIESVHRRDHRTCGCGNLSVDGGRDYIRRGYRDGEDSYQDTNETVELDDVVRAVAGPGISLSKEDEKRIWRCYNTKEKIEAEVKRLLEKKRPAN